MKAILLLLSFVFVSCVTSGIKARAVASEGCNIENYKDFINKPGVHNCNLQEADLRFAYLQGANLQEADLHGADLFWSNLRFANLQGAKLRFANLQEADLQGANLQGANLQGAKLRFANLHDVNLQGAKVTKQQAEYLKSENRSGFVVVE